MGRELHCSNFIEIKSKWFSENNLQDCLLIQKASLYPVISKNWTVWSGMAEADSRNSRGLSFLQLSFEDLRFKYGAYFCLCAHVLRITQAMVEARMRWGWHWRNQLRHQAHD